MEFIISIHALLAESDGFPGALRATKYQFLSTLSLRRATTDAINGCNSDIISIHALLAESDREQFKYVVQCRNFYPRSPCGERLLAFCVVFSSGAISIHALLAESDAL